MTPKWTALFAAMLVAAATGGAQAQTRTDSGGAAAQAPLTVTGTAFPAARNAVRESPILQRVQRKTRRLERPAPRREIRQNRRIFVDNGGPGRARANPARIRNYKAIQKQKRIRAAGAGR